MWLPWLPVLLASWFDGVVSHALIATVTLQDTQYGTALVVAVQWVFLCLGLARVREPILQHCWHPLPVTPFRWQQLPALEPLDHSVPLSLRQHHLQEVSLWDAVGWEYECILTLLWKPVSVKTFTLLLTGVVVLNGAIIPNHGFVLLDNVGEYRVSLLCLTDLPACCRTSYSNTALGDWFYPNGTAVPNMIINAQGLRWDCYRTRGQMMILMHRRRGGVTGIYRCDIPDQTEDPRRLYVGLYTANTGGYFQDSPHAVTSWNTSGQITKLQ